MRTSRSRVVVSEPHAHKTTQHPPPRCRSHSNRGAAAQLLLAEGKEERAGGEGAYLTRYAGGPPCMPCMPPPSAGCMWRCTARSRFMSKPGIGTCLGSGGAAGRLTLAKNCSGCTWSAGTPRRHRVSWRRPRGHPWMELRIERRGGRGGRVRRRLHARATRHRHTPQPHAKRRGISTENELVLPV